jgi:deazaflavin-dependent oxidoreductase (nitroreductase family)
VADRYVAPGWFTRNVFNRGIAGMTRLGLSIWGSRVLAVRGRNTNEWRTVPVNLLTHEGARYLVAPRGTTQWVRNIRVSKGGELRIGRRVEPISVVELSDDEKPAVLRAYLKRWRAEVGVFFDGTGPNASDDELLAIGPKHPVFRLVDRTASPR